MKAYNVDDLAFDSDAVTLARLQVDIRAATAQLILLAQDAVSIQYAASPVPSLHERGAYADPTFETATDTRRLGVRREVGASIKALRYALAELLAQQRHLENALENWRGRQL